MRYRILLVVLALSVSLASVALAAHPKKNAVYVGVWRDKTDKLSIHVSSTERSGHAKLWCFKAFQGTSSRFAISRQGYFKAAYYFAGSLEWSARGHFTSRTTAVASVHLAIACSGIGSARNLTLTLT